MVARHGADPFRDFVSRLFDHLVADKRLAWYQFEPRVEPILGMFVAEIVGEKLNCRVQLVGPQFPMSTAGNKVADFLLLCRSTNAAGSAMWVFVEIKTKATWGKDERRQVEAYLDVKKRGMRALYGGLAPLAPDGSPKPRSQTTTGKYEAWLNRFQGIECYIECPIDVVYLLPDRCRGPESYSGFRVIRFSELASVSMQGHSEVWKMFQSIVLDSLIKR